MDHTEFLKTVMNKIDESIKEKITIQELADYTYYSVYYFGRLFQKLTGMSVMIYVTRRKLQYALYDLSSGKRVIDVALEYGFETHAGFTKAFKRCYGCPPSLYCIHVQPDFPPKPELLLLKNGGIIMNPQIINKDSFTIAGYTSRHTMPNVKSTRDIPAFWDTVHMEYSSSLTKLHGIFSKSKHCEVSICYDADIQTGEFTYFLGVGVDEGELTKIEPDMHKMILPAGLYAVFTSPPAEESCYTQTIRDTWKEILLNWLPDSGYVFDESRYDYEYYDKRDHAWDNQNMAQMDIYLPIKKR